MISVIALQPNQTTNLAPRKIPTSSSQKSYDVHVAHCDVMMSTFGMGGMSVEEGVANKKYGMNRSMAMLKGMAACVSSLKNSYLLHADTLARNL